MDIKHFVKRLFQVFCVAAGLYGVFTILTALLPEPEVKMVTMNKSTGAYENMGAYAGTAVVSVAKDAASDVLHGAMTTLGSTVALLVVSKLKMKRRKDE